MNEEQFTLDALNQVRASRGASTIHQLPSGSRHDPSKCVVARALFDIDPTVLVYKEGIFTENETFAKIIARSFNYDTNSVQFSEEENLPRYFVPTPYKMCRFIDDFDTGLYPELVASK